MLKFTIGDSMSSKIFRTLDEQIIILKNKGLVIDNEEEVRNILLRENYFFINGYRFLFYKSPTSRCFLDNTNFKELYAMFNFDRQFRNIIFKNLLIIENNIKSIFSYQLSKKYGYREEEYLRVSNFTSNPEKSRQVQDLLKKMKRQIRINGTQHTATQHYQSSYGYLPLWVVVKVLSFGIVSELFTIMKREDEEEISNLYNISVEDLKIYLPILSNFRNLCAHEDILFDHKTQRPIPDTRFHAELSIPKTDGEYIYGKEDLFALIIIMKQMLRREEFKLMMNELTYEIDILEGKLKTIKITKVLDTIGFQLNFKEINYLD